MNVEQRQRQMLASLPLLLQEGANIGDLCRHIARTLSGEPEDCALEYGITSAEGANDPKAIKLAADELVLLGDVEVIA